MCVCVCVCDFLVPQYCLHVSEGFNNMVQRISTHTHIHIYMYICTQLHSTPENVDFQSATLVPRFMLKNFEFPHQPEYKTGPLAQPFFHTANSKYIIPLAKGANVMIHFLVANDFAIVRVLVAEQVILSIDSWLLEINSQLPRNLLRLWSPTVNRLVETTWWRLLGLG